MKKIKDLLNNTLVRNILINTIYAILILIYFVTLNTQADLLGTEILIKYINISSLAFLLIAIIMFEIGFKKDKIKLFIHGIEFLALAIFTLFIKHIPKIIGCAMKDYVEVGIYAYVGYYILKSVIQYTIKKQNELKSLSDIKEIVKEEPVKKVTKRKNVKEEGK